MPGYSLFARFGPSCHVRRALAIGCAICTSIIAGPANCTWAVYSTCDAQLSYFRDISEPGSSGLTRADRPLMPYSSRMRQLPFAGIALPRCELPLRLAGPSDRLCSDQTGVAILACHDHRARESALAEIMTRVDPGCRRWPAWDRRRAEAFGRPVLLVRHCTYRCAICTLSKTVFC